MWVAVKNIEPAAIPAEFQTEEVMQLAQTSDPLLTYHFGEDLIAIVGFVPLGLLSGTAYLWMQSTPGTFRHKTAVARLGKLTLDQISNRYQRITGHCVAGSPSIRWLTWLGARFAEPSGAAVQFMIGDV